MYMVACAVFYFQVGTHKPLPEYTTYPMSCSEAKNMAHSLQMSQDVYAIVRPVSSDWRPQRQPIEESK